MSYVLFSWRTKHSSEKYELKEREREREREPGVNSESQSK